MRCNHSYFCSSDFAHLILLFSLFKEYCSDFAHFLIKITLKFSQNFSKNTKKTPNFTFICENSVLFYCFLSIFLFNLLYYSNLSTQYNYLCFIFIISKRGQSRVDNDEYSSQHFSTETIQYNLKFLIPF